MHSNSVSECHHTHQGTETYVSAAFNKVHNTLLPYKERSFGPDPILVRDYGCLETVNELLAPSSYLHYTTLYKRAQTQKRDSFLFLHALPYT